ncbi:MAG: C39 family peptidase [Planctomycetota bacterium]
MIGPFIETLGVVLVAVGAWYVGRRLGRLESLWWMVGYIVPLVLLLVVSAGRRFIWLEIDSAVGYLMVGRMEFVLLGVVVCMLMSTLIQRLKDDGQKRALRALMVFAVCYMSVLPFLVPGLLYNYHLGMKTTLTETGVCLQTSNYTCGPAAAVTALRVLGYKAHEGRLAMLGHSSFIAGTPPDLMCRAITRQWGARGVSCRVRMFGGLDDLRNEIAAGHVVLAIVKANIFNDHYVTVVAFHEDGHVVVADPARGMVVQEPEAFMDAWRRAGVVIGTSADRPPVMPSPVPGPSVDIGGGVPGDAHQVDRDPVGGAGGAGQEQPQ